MLLYQLWIYHLTIFVDEVMWLARSSGFKSGELADTAVHVLLALVRPRHGYAVMQFLEEQSHGSISLGPASLYSTLKKLSDAGFITELENDQNRRVYQLSDTGQKVLVRNIERRRQLLAMADQILEEI
ncbi:PadR family transcriptional regulator [Corynebacterium phoceense]|uniref:PadR family transcriptional regulator n=1 Tax=Corynebacterium phoceense TaxID=1686286 RepID=UPI00211C79E4|nr:PadR family transcriptional regulator [Corynebacterium phoceense]MCQ9348241.1 PadR family transcriptional regulator [Corynebacterium phoceense]